MFSDDDEDKDDGGDDDGGGDHGDDDDDDDDCDDDEPNFMTSWTVMTPIPAYCGNRPTVTLANIS